MTLTVIYPNTTTYQSTDPLWKMVSKSKFSFCIIIPMFNEELGAKKCIDTVVKYLKKISQQPKLIIVNDGSKDSTKKILQKLSVTYKKRLTVIHHPKNQGYGAALQTGIRFAHKQGFTYGIFMDSDLTNHPKYIQKFIQHIKNHPKCDCVKASRFVKGGKMINVPLKRRFFTIMGNIITSMLFGVGIKDCTNGFRVTRLDLIAGIDFQEKSFAIILEELYYLKKKGAKICEIKNTLTNRKTGKTSFRYNRKTLSSYFRYALKAVLI